MPFSSKRNFLILSLLLLPLSAWAQYDIPTISTIVRPYECIPVMEVSSEDFRMEGKVWKVIAKSDNPQSIRAYGWSCYEDKHKIQDDIVGTDIEYLYDSSGTIQRVHTRYTLHSYYFMHDVRKPITRKNRKVHKDVYYGEQTTVFQNGLRISFTNFIPDYANDTLLLKYDSMGNLVYLYKYENGYQCVSPIKEEWFLHYDSLNRLVYVEWWKLAYSKGLPIRMHAFLYDEDRCIARVNDMPTGIPKGDLRQLHYETMPDGSVKLHVTRCDEDQGSDSLQYVQLHENPQGFLRTFFQKRMENCSETESERHRSSLYYPPQFFFSTGDYVFDKAGRLVSYHINRPQTVVSATIRYDSLGRVEEMVADTDKLVEGYGLTVPIASCTFVHYQYDERGNVVKIDFKTKENPDEQTISVHYTYDNHGNWISRSIDYSGKQQGTEEREIIYYQD